MGRHGLFHNKNVNMFINFAEVEDYISAELAKDKLILTEDEIQPVAFPVRLSLCNIERM